MKEYRGEGELKRAQGLTISLPEKEGFPYQTVGG